MKKIFFPFIFLTFQDSVFAQVRKVDNNLTSITLTPQGIDVKKGNLDIADDNISIGTDALKSNQPSNLVGTGNLAIGFEALKNNTVNAPANSVSGMNNVALGYRSLHLNQRGNWNTAVGNQTLVLGTNSNSNTTVGYGAGFELLGNENVAIGSNALTLGYYGNKNTVVGTQAGMHPGLIANTTDSANVFIGYKAGSVSGPKINKLYISNTDTENPLIWGDFYAAKLGFHGKVGIGTKNPLTNLHIYQTAGHSQILLNNSNIGTTLTDGLSLISDTNGEAHILNKENKPLNFGANNFGSYMTVYPAGEVGIGLLGFLPSANLHLHETEAGQATKFKISNAFSSLYGNDGFMFEYSTQGEMLMNNLETQNIILNSNPYNSTPELFVSGSSRVGIGTSNPTTKFEVNGFTKLGSDAPAIKIKKLTMQTASSDVEPNNITYVPHGLNGAKILGVQVLVEYAPNQYVPHAFTNNPSYEFHFLVNNTNDIELKVKPGNSSSILNKTAKIIITYEE